MSIRTKGKIIAGTSKIGVNLLDFKWADHILDDISWLRADTFSWQPGSVYIAVYEHLVNEFDVTKPIEAETFGGVTVYFRTSPDGHKIVLADGEQDVINMYSATGIAWYYILDRENKRFKLPRTKFGFTGLRDGVGKYVEAGLPNITGTIGSGYGTAGSIPWVSHTGTGALYAIQTSSSSYLQGGSTSTQTGLSKYGFDASRSNTTYGKSNTVQPKATQMYLYFYVGNSVRDEHVIDAGALAEAVNNFDVLAATDAVNETRDAAIVSVNATKDTSIQDIEAARDNSVLQLESMGNALNHTNISNCVTKIPQDLKLELADGVLTLKAGSKVYVPNGAGKFDVLVTEKDMSSAYSNVGGQNMLLVISDGSSYDTLSPTSVSSGSTDSLAGTPYHAWYDTTNNLVKLYLEDGVTVKRHLSLPFAITHGHNNGGSDIGVDGIDQVFNGFGYIGSTAFVLPGVKGLIPNGRNTDGTLKNTTLNITDVKTFQTSSSPDGARGAFMTSAGTIESGTAYIVRNSESELEKVSWKRQYCLDTNTIWVWNGSAWIKENKVFVSYYKTESASPYRVSSFVPKPVFHAVDYNDFTNKADKDLSNLPSNYDYVIKTYTSGNSWYRQYKSGWVEQGGSTMTGSQTVTFLIPFKSVPTMTWGFCTQRGSASYDGEVFFRSITATNFVSGSRMTNAISPGFMWEAKGYAA